MNKVLAWEVSYQGGPLVSSAAYVAEGDTIVAIEIDMHSKYCGVSGFANSQTGVPSVLVAPTDGSIGLAATRPTDDTHIDFPDHRGWRVFAADCGRYTVSVCLVKERFK